MNGLYYKGTRIADKGFILNLPHRKDRLEESTRLLDDMGFEGYEIFNGHTLDDPDYKKLGCTSSYLKMFEHILNTDAQDLIVFEDDIKLMNTTSVKDIDNIFNDWQIIKESYDIVALGTKLLPRSKIKIQSETHGSFEEMLCTQSFYYKRPIIQHIYDELKGVFDSEHYLHKCTIDMFLNDCSSETYRFIHSINHKKFNFGITIPMIFTQTSSYSDNEELIQNYESEMETSFNNAMKQEKAYILYSTENYFDIVTECVKSIREFSNIPILVYLMNSDKIVDVSNTKTIRWDCEIGDLSDDLYEKQGNNFYINRKNSTIYQILTQRPLVVKDALLKYADVVCYVDSDSIATPLVDNIFSYFKEDSSFPYFVEGVYEYLRLHGRGGGGGLGGTLEDTLEYNACELFNVDQTVRKFYRQSGYFVSGQNTYDFLDEWHWMCSHPKIIKDVNKYAPYNEETISNVLLWKNNIHEGLPYIYVNGTVETVKKMYKDVEYKGPDNFNFAGDWLRVPHYKEHLLFFHGEKNIEKMREMVSEIKKYNNNNLRILFVAPHLSTGGMPAYLLNRIEILKKYHPEVEIYVIEYCKYSTIYNVQKDRIRELIPEDRYWTLNLLDDHSDENSLKIIDIIKENSIDIVHVDEILEGFDSFNQVSKNVLNAIFDNHRTWKVVETCHNIYFNPKNRHFSPDAYSFCTPYHKEIQFKDVDSYSEVFEFPIEKRFVTPEEKIEARTKLGLSQDKIHVINVGLWTKGKNQGEGIEIARHLQNEDIQFHFIGNQASNFEDYWKPFMVDKPSNVTIWGERNDVDDFMKAADIFLFNSTIECNPLVLREAASFGLKIFARNLPQYFNMFTPYITEIDGDVYKTSELIRELKYKGITRTYDVTLNQSENLSNKHVEFYEKVKSSSIKQQPRLSNNIQIFQHYVEQPFIEIKGDSSSSYNVKVYDEKNKLHYENTISANSWIKMNRKYFTEWRTEIFEDDVLIWDKKLNYEGKRVFISFDSKSLGDSVAWIPYCLEFQNKHNCKVIVSTFWNKLFEESYPELEFINPGSVVHNLTGMYKLGWFWDESKEPETPNTIPLQKAASNILGLEYKEIKPRVHHEVYNNPYKQKYITIATNSTAGCKFWTKNAWQELVNYFVSKGYLVVNVSKENNELTNVMKFEDVSIENTMNVIHHSEFFVGLSSGLSWLAWGLGKQVVMISNFTTSDHEFNIDCIRITNPLVCNGCWNNPNFKFDKGDWNWCPVHKGTSRQFECHTSITSEMVINKIQNLLQ